MKILVTSKNLEECLSDLQAEEYIGLDTETYGLRMEDRMFCLQLATEQNQYYFNFLEYPSQPYVWDMENFVDKTKKLFADADKTWFIHNAKFDMHKLCNEGITLSGTIHCTEAIARIIYNQHMHYSLDACLKRIGHRKDDKVKEYIKKHKLYTKEKVTGKKRSFRNDHYDLVPFDLMFEYGCIDTEMVRVLGMSQLDKIYDQALYDQETELTKTCFNMERTGITINKEYVRYAKEKESQKLEKAIEQATEYA